MKGRKRFRRRKSCLGTRSHAKGSAIIMQSRPAYRMGKTTPLRVLHARWDALPVLSREELEARWAAEDAEDEPRSSVSARAPKTCG